LNIVDTIRVQFSKKGRAKYISHLDLMRTMTRVLRRAAIPLWYTEGFSKHPYITFASPLSLGYEGECEYMDFRLEQPMTTEEIVDRLNQNMPEGISVSAAGSAKNKVGDIASSRWKIVLPLAYRGRLEDVLAMETIEVQKRTKKKTFKTVDIKPFITDASVTEEEEKCVLYVTLPTGEQSINPSLLLGAVYGEELCNAQVTRLGVFTKTGEKFS